MNRVLLGEREVGDGLPCYVIAEIGANHNRDWSTALRLIDTAADAGVDAVKFQTYSGTALYSTKTPRFDYLGHLGDTPAHELLEDISLPRDWQMPLAEHSQQRGVHFLSSPFDRAAVDELDRLGVPAFKIASFEIVDLPFLTYVGAKGRPVILSTGMATLGEIEEAMAAVKQGGPAEICLLQCASLYPAPPRIINLRAMSTMRAAFRVPIGFSDHTLGLHVPLAAVALGAALLEKHITLDRTHAGPDHAFAIEPDELRQLVTQIRDVEVALGEGQKSGPSPEESAEMYGKARRSIVAARDIPRGTRIKATMLTVKRPGYGIKPRELPAVIGRVASRNIEEDEILTWDML